MILRLPYGRDVLNADLRGLHCHALEPHAPHHAHDAATLVAHALDHPEGTAPLAELARGRRAATVLVPDATRRAWLPEVLPVVLARLGAAGMPDEAIAVLVACGTHPPAPEDELRGLLGALPEGVRVLQHEARDEHSLVEVGKVPSGMAIRLHRAAVEADLLIAVSTVQHHYFAGFGGGPKMVFPGVAGYAETQTNHAQVIDLASSPPRRNPACEPGLLDGNPIAEEIRAATALRPPHLALLMVAGGGGRPGWAAAGDLDRVFPAACQVVRDWYEITAGPFGKLVVSAGGYPTDHTLIQAHKALEAACRFAEPGAEVLFVAACDGGSGSPDMEPFLADPRPGAVAARLARHYVQYGHTTLRLLEKTARFHISVVTQLGVAVAERLGLHPVGDPEIVLDRWREESPGATVGLMAGATVYPSRA